MNRTTDLDIALEFVARRIQEEAIRVGQPLNCEEYSLLNNLPTAPAIPVTFAIEYDVSAVLLPRDTSFEKLCTFTKAANRNDLQLNPASAFDWQFAAAVLKLNRHPMSWLLQWAGIKVPRPWWDQWLLLVAALFFVFLIVDLVVFGGTKTNWVAMGLTYVVTLAILFIASKRIENWQLEQTIERCRRDSIFRLSHPN